MRDVEQEQREDQKCVKPLVDSIFNMVREHDLNYRQFKRLIDVLIQEGWRRFKVSA